MLNKEFDWAVENSANEEDWAGEDPISVEEVDIDDNSLKIINGVIYEQNRNEK